MAEDKCISQMIEVERRAHLMASFCEMADQLAGDETPAWLLVMWTMVRDMERDVVVLGETVRAGCASLRRAP